MNQIRKQQTRTLRTGYDVFVLRFRPIPAVVSRLTNALAPPPIALESYSRAQTDRTVFLIALEKNFLGGGGCGFFVSYVISEVVFGPF